MDTSGDARGNAKSHEQLRVLSIRGKSYCNSACVFCIEKFTTRHPVAPKVDETRQLIVEGAGKYNMLFFMNGEPSVHPKLFEYVDFAKTHGYRYFGMSSHFRAFADPAFALKVLEAGFEFFDISLHAATLESQNEVNPIGDGGLSLKEALHGLRNILELARRSRKHVGITHKIVITQLNYRALLAVFRATYRLGVRNYILQPVKVSGLEPDLMNRLAIGEDEFMPFVNDFLQQTEELGVEVKLYGMSQIGAYASKHVVQETNVIKQLFGKKNRPQDFNLVAGDRLIPHVLPTSTAVRHRIELRVPTTDEIASFECAEDQFILNAALASGFALPFGCRMGSCGSCCGRITEGKLDQSAQIYLSEEQIGQGYALLCKSKPRSNLVIITHQEMDLAL